MKKSYMSEGLCAARHCFARGPRCGHGYCEKCCKAFHTHASASTSLVPISTAIQPAEPVKYEYAPGKVELIWSETLA